MTYSEISATYGSNQTPTTLFVATKRNGASWYVCEGSCNVNCTYAIIEDGCDIEEIGDFDTFTTRTPINSIEDLQNELE